MLTEFKSPMLTDLQHELVSKSFFLIIVGAMKTGSVGKLQSKFAGHGKQAV